MASPFRKFRRHQKVFLALLGVAVIIAFVILPPIMDMLSTAAGVETPAVHTKKYGDLKEDRLRYLVAERLRLRDAFRDIARSIRPNSQTQRDKLLIWLDWLETPDEDAVVNTWLLSRRAEELGLVCTRETAAAAIHELHNGQLGRQDLLAILKRHDFSELRFIGAIQRELQALHVQLTFLGLGNYASTPAQRWDYYKRLNQRATIELVAIPVANYVDLIPEPSETTLRKFFEEHKDNDARADSPTPGFHEPYRANIRYFRADRILYGLRAVSEEEILQEFQRDPLNYQRLEAEAKRKAEEREAEIRKALEKLRPKSPDSAEPSTEEPSKQVQPPGTVESPLTPPETTPKPDTSPAAQPAPKPDPQQEPASKPDSRQQPVPKPDAPPEPDTPPQAEPPSAKSESPPAADQPQEPSGGTQPAAPADNPPAKQPPADSQEPGQPQSANQSPPAPAEDDGKQSAARPYGGAMILTVGLLADEPSPPSSPPSEPAAAEQDAPQSQSTGKADAKAANQPGDTPADNTPESPADTPSEKSADKAPAQSAGPSTAESIPQPPDQPATVPLMDPQPEPGQQPGMESEQQPKTEPDPQPESKPQAQPPKADGDQSKAEGDQSKADDKGAKPNDKQAQPHDTQSPVAPASEKTDEPDKAGGLSDYLRNHIRNKLAHQKLVAAFQRVEAEVNRYRARLNRKGGSPPAPLDFVALAEENGLDTGETGLIADWEAVGLELARLPDFFETMFAKGDTALYVVERNFDPKETDPERQVNPWYIYFKVDQTPEQTPSFDEPRVRELVLQKWREVEARQLARDAAQRVADAVRKSGRSLSEYCVDRPEYRVTLPEPFTWLTRGLAGPTTPDAPPRISPVDGVEMPGEEFMRTVFELEKGGVGTAMNAPQTHAYVIRVISFDPASDDLLWERFAAASWETYRSAAAGDDAQFRRAWIEHIRQEAGLKWQRRPQRVSATHD